MENKINIAEILKDCPIGMELDCTLFEGLEFDSIVDNEHLPIRCRIKNPNGGYNVYNFTKYGCWLDTTFAKCVIFPKGKTTWEGFVPPYEFKDGDILCNSKTKQPFILKFFDLLNNNVHSYCGIDGSNKFYASSNNWAYASDVRFATEEEKQKLFEAIKDNGYKWNEETKTLEKLVEPKFKVGDRIRHKLTNKDDVYEINSVYDDSYGLVGFTWMIYMKYQDQFELVPNKFDINTLKPFDKVLARCSSLEKWHIDFFEAFNGKTKYPFTCLHNNSYKECIPYEGNEHLLGTTNDCDEYYKNWE